MESTVIKNSLLRAQVRQVLLEQLVDGRLAPGASIRDAALAESLGVSRTPLREALLELARDGIIEAVARKGFVVREMSAGEFADNCRMLEVLESLALKRANSSIYSSVPELRKLTDRARRTIDDPETQFELDERWHGLLLAHCGSRRIRETILPIRDQSRRYGYAFVHLLPPSTIGIDQHDAVVDALERHDLNLAAQRLAEHWCDCAVRYSNHCEVGNANDERVVDKD